MLARHFVIHVPGMPGPVDRETHLQGIGIFAMAFSEIDFTVESQIAEGDLVATRLTWQATHAGDFQGLAPNGKHIAINAVTFDRIKDGKIVERWFNQNDLGLMQQLGAIPSPQPSS